MKTEQEYETFGPEWRASLKGMSKAHIIELFSQVGKEKEKLEEINAELLEALKECLEGVEELNGEYQEGWDEVINKAKAAISKAEGKTE